jgi:uroporphyrinogen-III synthase
MPLTHRRIVNTRAPHQAGALDELLRAHGAEPVSYPCIDIVTSDSAQFDVALRNLKAGYYQWLAFTSVNTVIAVARRLAALHLTLDAGVFRAAAIGPATRDAAHAHLGISTVVLPEEFVAESLAMALPVRARERVLLPESDIARPVLAAMLRQRGAEVTVVPAYRTVCGEGGAPVPQMIADGEIDALAFTSPSTVTNFLERVRRAEGSIPRALDVCAVCIGPVTSDAARKSGFTRVLEASEYTLSGLVDVLNEFFSDHVAREERS